MLDVFFLPNNESAPNSDIQYFVGAGTNTGAGANKINDAHEWKKPRGISMVHIFCIGGGGGGGGGFSAAAGSGKGGGGGGGTSSIATLIIPARLLPDKLYVLPGNGGIGGTAGNAGTPGSISYVLLALDFVVPIVGVNALLASSNNVSGTGAGAGAGSPGTATTGGTGGGTPTAVFSAAAGVWSGLGVFGTSQSVPGSSGGAANGNASNVSYGSLTVVPLLGGTGGGGSGGTGSGTGGSFSMNTVGSVFNTPLIDAIPPVTAAGANGGGGFQLGPPIYPFFMFGGQGGGGANAAVGGNGGHGSIPGAGGGGGAGGTTGGTGGDGGPGLVVITCW